MSDLSEVYIGTRSREVSPDYKWLGSKTIDFSWRDKYKALFIDNQKELNCLVEIDSEQYRIYFDRIYRTNQTDYQSRILYFYIGSEGKRGSDSSRFMFLLLYNYFKDEEGRNRIEALFDKFFLSDDVEKFLIEDTEDTDSKIAEKLDEIQVQLEDCNKELCKKIEPDIFDFLPKEEGYNLFLSELRNICNSQESEKVSLIITETAPSEKDIEKDFMEYKSFDKGLCISSNKEKFTVKIKDKSQLKPLENPAEVQSEWEKFKKEAKEILKHPGKIFEEISKNGLTLIIFVVLLMVFIH